jgi:hypothetical protein
MKASVQENSSAGQQQTHAQISFFSYFINLTFYRKAGGMSTEKVWFGSAVRLPNSGKRQKKALSAICGQCFENQGEQRDGFYR